MQDLLGMELPALARVVADLGERPFRARQIYRWLYSRRAVSIQTMTDLSAGLRRHLEDRFVLRWPRVAQIQISEDGTRKFLLSPASGGQVESVFIPERDRVTFCISPQIGCALDCSFCLTARLGFVRNLSAGEIVGQVLVLLEETRREWRDRPVNIVMMGMGEALHNYDNAIAAVRILADPEGAGIPARRITLSTAGMVPGIGRLAAEPIRPKLAVSLNAATDEVRSRVMPINRKYPLEVLLDACGRYPLAPRERLTFEYVLLRGINDSRTDPGRLASLLNRHRLKAKVNLIPFNPTPELPYEEPAAETVRRFRDELLARGVAVSIRKNRGRDISAACGQLALVSAASATGPEPPP